MNEEELLDAFRRAEAAGDSAAAQTLATLYGQAREANKPPEIDQNSGSIADALGQGLSFGFSDEIAGGLGASVNSIAGLFGGGSGESFGDAYEGIRDAARYNNDAFAARNPKTALGAEIAGGLLTGGTGAARVGALKGAQSIKKLAAVGTGEGSVYGAGASEADTVQGLLEDTALGGATGAVGGAAIPAVGRAIANKFKNAGKSTSALGQVTGLLEDTGAASGGARYADDVAALREKGVKLTTGQQTGNDTVKAYETTLRGTSGGGAINKTMDTQREQFQTELLRMAGAPSAVAQTGRITDDAIEATGAALADKYSKALKGKRVVLGDEFIDGLAAVEQKHNEFVSSRQRGEIRSLIDDFLDKATEGGVSGEAYQKLRSLMGKRQRQNQNNNAPLADLFGDLRGSLDDAFTSSVGGSNKKLNNQYAQFKQLQTLWKRGGGTKLAQGELPLASLNSLAKKSPGSPEWKKFINSASAVLGDATPNSGTAARTSLLKQMANIGSGGAVPATALAGRYGASQALANGVGSQAPQAIGGLLSATGRGVQNTANLAGATSGVAAVPGLLSNPQLPPL